MKTSCTLSSASRLVAAAAVVAVSILAFAPGAFGQEVKPLPDGEGATKPSNDSAQGQATGPIDYSRTFNRKEVTQKANILFSPEPAYTPEARQNEIEGTVVLRAVLESSGKITNIQAVVGMPYGLTEKAIEAARQIKFEPAVKDGHRVSQYIQIEYNFNLFVYENDPTLKSRVVILEKPEALYTEEARHLKVQGKVVLEVSFKPSEGPQVLRVIESLPYGLIEQAIAAAEKIKFKPAIGKQGHPVTVIKKIEYKFKL